jgi:hypothetical protein
MSETTALPPPEEPFGPPPPPPERPRREFPLAWATGAGFLIVAVALFLVWRHPAPQPLGISPQQFEALQARIAELEQRPPPQGPDLGPLNARVAALERRPPPSGAAAPAPDLSPLEGRMTALEQRRVPDLAPLEARVAALEGANVARRLDADEARIAAIERRAGRAAQVQAAGLALSAGQRLGDLPGAPPALTRFADASPPTEASLRQAFSRAAREALAASRPDTVGKPLLTRLWVQAQDLVTIRQGDRVLVGDPTAGVLERARAALDAGNLAGAVAEVATLQDGPAQAMAGWLSQARSLVEARAALAAWAAAG